MVRRLRLVIPLVIVALTWGAISAAQPTFATKRVINSFVNGLLPFDVRTEDIEDLTIRARGSMMIAWADWTSTR